MTHSKILIFCLGTRVNFTSDAVTPISKPGKQPAEDPSVGVIRNILRWKHVALILYNTIVITIT